MTITNYFSSSSDVIFFKKGESFEVKAMVRFEIKASCHEYCIFGIDFSKVITYQVKKTTGKKDKPAAGVFVTLEGGEEYILMRSMSTPCFMAVLEKIYNDSLEIKEVFDLLLIGFFEEFEEYIED